MLEDMPKDIGIYFGIEVVLREFSTVFFQYLIRDLHGIQQGIRREKSTVVGMNLRSAGLYSADIEVAEVFLEAIKKRTVFVELIQFVPLGDDLIDAIGRQQAFVLRKEDKEEAVEQLLAFLIEHQLIFTWIMSNHILPELLLESGVISIELLGNLLLGLE